jgi:hypothetical protein
VTIALVTADEQTLAADPDPDMPTLIAALADRGASAMAIDWRTETTWSEFELVVLRSPWNYAAHFSEFQRWLDLVSTRSTLLNPVDLVRWNLDKRYLADFSAAGVPTVTTTFVTDVDALHHALGTLGGDRVVIKPSVSAGSKDTGLYESDDPQALALGTRILASGRTVMVQPELPEVSEHGETALIFFGGEFSHAVHKGPILQPGGGLIGGRYQEVITAVEAHVAQRDLGSAAINLVRSLHPGVDGRPPAYARIDIAEDAGQHVILEAELVEPNCFLGFDQSAPDRFAATLRSYLN